MYKVISISIKDKKLISAIEQFKSSGGNLSGLVSKLLENYFFGDDNKEIITKEMMLLLDIKKKLDEFLRWKEKILPKLQELEEKLKKEQEIKETEENLHLIRELREIVFTDDLAKTPEEFFKRFEGREHDLSRAVKTLLSSWASEKQISYPEAVKLFFKAFPELKDCLKDIL